jgi:tetratricopeptide (TPR) repeat protein
MGVYLKTMAPTVSFWDCGEFIASSYIMGVPHPPGSPLYVLLGRVFSLIPFSEVAWRVTLMSALSSALAVWCVYLSTVALGRRALGGAILKSFNDSRDYITIGGAALAALSLAFSYTHWYNATEAEVYGYSIFFACAGTWIILYWEGTEQQRAGAANDRWLYLIAYFFGLGGGIHLLCLLTIPTLLVLMWYAEERLRRLIPLLVGLSVWIFICSAAMGPGTATNIATLAGLAGLLYYLYNNDRRACWLLLGALLLFGLGYSTYFALYIRSGLNPIIDENDPENLAAFIKFINREQYGTESQLLSLFSARAERTYQFWDQQMKYFFQQFPFPVLERTVVFRWATGPQDHPISISAVPYLLGLFGLFWHATRDWRRFLAIFAMFAIMGFGLSLYLNMPDPQPRERHYVFGGMYFSFALWMGLGWIGLLEILRQKVAAFSKPALIIAAACFGLLLPAGIAAKLYHIQDRTGDYIAYDYAANILESCAPNSLLFTNGDNDTFPLWFLQEVEGVRRDVRVINLSLLNTNWYIKQLRDREPKVDIQLSDNFIDSVLTDTQLVDLYKRLWREPKVPPEFKNLGLDVTVQALPGHDLLRVQDIMVIGIVYWNQWKKPINFAITVAGSARIGLEPYLRMEGMTMRMVPERDLGPDPEALARNIFDVYRYRGVNDPEVYKDENTSRLLGNYRACVMQLAELYVKDGRGDELGTLFRWAQTNINFGWESYYTSADFLQQSGQTELASEFTEKAGNELIKIYGQSPTASYDNVLALAGILLNTYEDYERAERLYRRATEIEPGRWDAYYELAATMQAQGRADAGLDMLNKFRDTHGPIPEIEQAIRILQKALEEGQEPAAQP